MLGKLTALYKELGAVAGLLYLVDRVLRGFSARTRLIVYDLMVQPLDEPSQKLARPLKGFSHRQIRPGDPELRSFPVPPAVIEARFRQGAICLGVFKREALAGYIWFAFGAYDEDEVRCRYVLGRADEAVFDFDLYVFPEHRLGFAFAAIWREATAVLNARGIRRSFSRVSRFNTASRRAHAHLGARPVGRAAFLKLWRLECMAATVPPYVSVSVAGRPSLPLDGKLGSEPFSVEKGL